MVAPRRIHISNDMLVCGNIWESDPDKADVIFSPDLLSFGPIFPFSSPVHSQSRIEYWNCFFSGLFDASSRPDPFQALVLALEKIRAADEIMIWSGPSLDEQLFVVWVIAALLYLNVQKDKLRYLLVTEDNYYCRPIASLNTLSRKGFSRSHQRGGEVFDNKDFETLDIAWRALCSPDPYEITRCRKHISPRLSLIIERIAQLKLRYPYLKTGLNAYDSRLLQICARCGPMATPIVIDFVSNDHGEFDYYGDVIFHGHLLRMASTDLMYPLLKVAGDTTAFRSFTVELTDAGRSVLLGESNFVELNGIDEWIGGVHLQCRSELLWSYDPAKDSLVPTIIGSRAVHNIADPNSQTLI